MLLMHGLGDTSQGWSDVAMMLAKEFPFLKLVLPTAPTKPVTLNGGERMPSWYDIIGLDSRAKETCEGIDDSVSTINSLIQNEINSGIKSERIIVAGFSQGGAMAITTGLKFPSKLGGVVALSGYLPRPNEFVPSAANKNTKVFFGHGDEDDVVQLPWAQLSADKLKGLGVTNVEFKIYKGMPHSACRSEIDDVIDFVRSAMGSDEL